MFYVTKEVEISAAHSLDLPYSSPCNGLHGHNWKIKVFCKSETLNHEGMVVDFTVIKSFIKNWFDHKNLNEVSPFYDAGSGKTNSTAENIAFVICEKLDTYGCYRVEVQEVDGSWAAYEETDNG